MGIDRTTHLNLISTRNIQIQNLETIFLKFIHTVENLQSEVDYRASAAAAETSEHSTIYG